MPSPSEQRGFALGFNIIAGVAAMFIGLIAGGLLAEIDWRLVFLVSVPFGLFGTVWAYLKLHEIGRAGGRPASTIWGTSPSPLAWCW